MVVQRVQRLREARSALTDTRGLTDIADGLLARQCTATGAQAGIVALVNGDVVEVVAFAGYEADYLEPWQHVPLTARTPLTDAVRTRETVVVASVDELMAHYPDIPPPDEKPHALAAFPLLSGDEVLGAVGLRFDVGTPDDEVMRAGEVLSDVTADALVQRRSIETLSSQVGQLQTALDSRIVIEQAKGILAERHEESVDAAFERLRRHARNNSLRLHELAHRVVEGTISL